MYIVQNITSDGKQIQRLVLQDGAQVNIAMEYMPQQYGWFFTSISYLDFELTNIRICVSPNMLYQFKNKIPFGIAITTQSGFEPTQQQDFSSGFAKMYILTEDELQDYTDFLQNG